MQSLLHIKYYPSISILQVKYYPSLAGTYVAFTAGAVFTAGNVLPSILQVNYYSSIDGTYKYAVFTTGKVLPQYQYIANKVLPQP